jgi:hypothetical protein
MTIHEKKQDSYVDGLQKTVDEHLELIKSMEAEIGDYKCFIIELEAKIRSSQKIIKSLTKIIKER